MAVTETAPLLRSTMPPIPPAPWSKALPSAKNPARRLPQAIAHRGYKSRYPENSMAAFRAAVDVGTHAIETDIHLSSDREVVLSHDGNLKRCFGVDKPVRDCPWSYLSTLRSLRAPHEPMPRLTDLLRYLAEPGRDKVWILLDVKLDDDPDELLAAVADATDAVPRADGLAWDQRIVVGCWSQAFLHAALTHLPTYSAAHISHSPYNSNRFLDCPEYAGLSFNVLQPTLVGPYGSRFIRRVRSAPDAESRRLYVWTVNQVEWMEWSVRKGMDGVVTDDPAKFLKFLERWEEAEAEDDRDGQDAARDTGDEGASGETPSGTSLETTATGLRRWTWLYFQVAVIQLLLFLLTPWLVRRSRWRFTRPGKEGVPKA